MSDKPKLMCHLLSVVSLFVILLYIGQHLSTELATCNNLCEQSRNDTVLDGGNEHVTAVAF